MATTLRQHDQFPFLTLPENRLGVAAIQEIAPLKRRRTIQIVTLVGPPGTGKSRLARELIRSWEAKRSDGKIVYVTASEFTAQFTEAAAADSIAQFQRRYRSEVALFVCEDIQTLSGQKETQLQLVSAIDEVVTGGGCVLFTSTKMPSGIRRISSRLANRIRGGLSVTLEQPEQNSREKLLQHFLSSDSVRLSSAEIALIASKYNFSPRELMGLIRQLHHLNKGRKGEKGNLEQLIDQICLQKSYRLPQIAKATAKVFGVRVAEMKSPRRSQSISQARQVAMYLARELTDLNYKQVGEYFGRGNHSTVIHGCKKIEGELAANPILAHQVEQVEKFLEEN